VTLFKPNWFFVLNLCLILITREKVLEFLCFKKFLNAKICCFNFVLCIYKLEFAKFQFSRFNFLKLYLCKYKYFKVWVVPWYTNIYNMDSNELVKLILINTDYTIWAKFRLYHWSFKIQIEFLEHSQKLKFWMVYAFGEWCSSLFGMFAVVFPYMVSGLMALPLFIFNNVWCL